MFVDRLFAGGGANWAIPVIAIHVCVLEPEMFSFSVDPLTAGAVTLATAATDAVYVMFTAAVASRRRVPAANWSSLWYVLSSYAVINYTENAVYICFAALGSWLGAFVSVSVLHRSPSRPPTGAALD